MAKFLKILFFLFLLFPRFSEAEKIRIFFWNLEKGLSNAHLDSDYLNHTLSSLPFSSDAPDVIILAEFKYEALTAETLRLLRSRYHQVFIPYNKNTPETGIVVFMQGRQIRWFSEEDLDWTPLSMQDPIERETYRRKWIEAFPESYYFQRQYLRLAIRLRDGNWVNIVPVHLLQPWSMYLEKYGKILGHLVLGPTLLWGRNNPWMAQAARLRTYLERDFGKDFLRHPSNPFVLIGDFNMMDKIGPFSPIGYRRLSKGLIDAFSGGPHTFPAEGSLANGHTKIRIDHGFISSGSLLVTEAVSPRIPGSDHYPIVLVLKTGCDGEI